MASSELIKFQHLLRLCIEREASDLHISSGKKAAVRCQNELMRLDEFFDADEFENLIRQILDVPRQAELAGQKGLDLAYCFRSRRFRLNIYSCLNGRNMAVRLIRSRAVSIDSFDRADVLKQIAMADAGLVLICGAAGSGKSSTLASLIEYINQTRACHIITLEEPIEYVFEDRMAVIHQREFNEDFKQFAEAVKEAMRQDPDVLMVGEVRDAAAMKAVLDAAETGHLVLATLHASSAQEALERVLSFFPASQIQAVSSQISVCLKAVICQRLLTKKKSLGDLVCCMEILLSNPAVKNIIRQNRLEQLATQMQLGRAQGMQSMQEGKDRLKARQLLD